MKNILVQRTRQVDVAEAWTEAYRTSILTEFYPPWPLGFQGHDVASTGMAAHEKYTCTANQTGGRYVRMDWWISSKYSFRILPSLLAKPPKDILKYLTPDYVK
jgi:hypothetical protein